MLKSLAITALVILGLFFTLKHAHVGIYLWSWISYMNPHRLVPYGFAYTFPYAKIIAIVVLLCFVVTKNKRPLPAQPLMVVWLILVFWFVFTTFFALVQPDAWMEFDRTIKIQLFALLTVSLIYDKKKLEGLALVIVASIGFFGVKGGAFAVATGGNYLVWGPPESFISGNNELALAMITVIPLMRYFQMQLKRKLWRHIVTICMLLTTFASISSHSRGALLALAAMVFFLILMSRSRLPLIIGVCILSGTIYNFMPDHYFERMETIETYDEDASAMGRIEAWTVGYNIAVDRPLVGGGFRAFTPWVYDIYGDFDEFHDVHSIYFEMLGEHGFVGLILYLLLFFLAFMTGFWVRVRAHGIPELQWAIDFSSMVQVCLVGFAVGGAFLGLAYFDLPYHLAAMMVIIRSIVEKHLKDPNSSGLNDGDKVTVNEASNARSSPTYGMPIGELRKKR